MQSGHDYTATDLAQRFDEPTTVVRDMLCTLIEEGRVDMVSHSSRIMRFRRAAICSLAEPHQRAANATPVNTSIATPLVKRTMTGNLQGYDAALTQQRMLAMVARPPLYVAVKALTAGV